MSRILSGILFVLSFSAAGAYGQMMSNPSQWYINNQIYSTRVFNGVVANSMLRKGAKGTKRQGSKKASEPNKSRDYTVFKETANSSLAKTLAGKSGAQNSREAGQMLDSFIGLYKQTAAKDGFPANDLAYAFEYFVVNNYQIYHNLVDVPLDKDPRARAARDGFDRITIMNEKKLLQVSIPQEQTIYQQFKAILSENPEIQKMTDAQKQEATELLATLVGVNFTAYMNGINNEDERITNEARQMAKDGLEKLLGASIDRIKINAYGLEL